MKVRRIPVVETTPKPKWFPGSTLPLPMVVDSPKPFSGKKKQDRKTGYDLDFWNIERDGITQSIIAAFEQCPQKVYLKMKKGLTLGEFNYALDFGSLFHHVLDRVYSQRVVSLGKAYQWSKISIDALTEEYNNTIVKLVDSDIQRYELLYGLCSLVLSKYLKWYQEQDGKATIIAVEKEFCIPYVMRNGVSIPLRGKIDRLDKIGNDYWLFETKTKKEIEPNQYHSVNGVIESMKYNLQCMTYCLAVKHLYGVYPKGIIYNLVKSPQQKFTGTFYKKPETLTDFIKRVSLDIDEKSNFSSRKSEYFERVPVPLSRENIEEYKAIDFDYVIEKIYDWSTTNARGFRNSQSCYIYRSPCEFFSLCTGTKTEDEYDIREALFPELTENLEIE